jgi:RimJ/RimL family protein N-acetyltransferase
MAPSEVLLTTRLTLTPLAVADAAEMVEVLSDPELYAYTGGEPPTFDQLQERYRFQVASPPPGERWYNWIIRLQGAAIGFVQATVSGQEAGLAWLVGAPWQGRGYATEASTAMRDWLADQGITAFSAHIHPNHRASQRIATSLELHPTGQLDDEGEMIWK